MAQYDPNRDLAEVNKEIALTHLEAARETLRKARAHLDLRTVAIAQMAATIITNPPHGGTGMDARGAVKVAREIMAETESQLAAAKSD